MKDRKSLLALLIIVVGLAMLSTVVIVALFPSTVEEGSIADKYIKPHTEEIEEMSAQERGDRLRVFHDDKRNVTCWVWAIGTCRGGISCIPDHLLSP